ncbi:hypothetical protein WA1_02585 [Scytonema hofmannii PCC 7110]|uniref:Effector-associated domain-containing protein n=1 Tax=Scytonema hofmannii PCC 7110 TaxID=128403 RepID=A0A139XH76_9CYAN|nr:hypothetical protein [Scytonema hofmannii]KYC44047.1 hypothetical protein WA1_02585 [Scytonema hofmannii PCC 7110]
MAELSGEIIQELSRVLRPFMWDKQQRQSYLVMALGTNANVLNRLVWDTSVDVFIPQMVKELVAFEEIASGKPALCILLEVIRENVGVDIQPKIDNLLQQIREELIKKENQVPKIYSQVLDEYFTVTLDKLREQGCLDIRKNQIHSHCKFSYVAKISDFELSFGIFSMRGEAFFLFSEFASINMKILQRFTSQCSEWAREKVNPSTVGQAIYNFRAPTHLCFAVAIVDTVDDKTVSEVQTTNPLDHSLDLLWYEVPVIYELSRKKLYFYNKPSNFWENFKGEVVWKKLRTVIQDILSG